MREETIYDTLKSSVDSVHVQLRAETTRELHEALCAVWAHCAARETGSDDMALISAPVATEVARLFRKMGVACHVDARPETPTPLSVHVTVIAGPPEWGVHTICFSLVDDAPKLRCRGPF
jgi:hypothetical protein